MRVARRRSKKWAYLPKIGGPAKLSMNVGSREVALESLVNTMPSSNTTTVRYGAAILLISTTMANPTGVSSVQQWLNDNSIDSLDTLLVPFVFAFVLFSNSPIAVLAITLSYLIGNKHGKTETFYSGRQTGYREGIKEGLKQGRYQSDVTKMQVVSVLLVTVFLVGLFIGFKGAKVLYHR